MQLVLSNIVWEGDFPHRTCTDPESWKYIDGSLEGISDTEKRTMLVDNAVSLFDLSPI